jgi:hypothetical protein
MFKRYNTQSISLNYGFKYFTLLSKVSHVNILNFVPGVVRAIAPNICGSNVYDHSQVPNNCSIALSRPHQSLPYIGATPGYFVSIIMMICCTVRERYFFKCYRTHPAIKLDVSRKRLRSSGGILQLWGCLFVMILYVVEPSSGLAYNLQGQLSSLHFIISRVL